MLIQTHWEKIIFNIPLNLLLMYSGKTPLSSPIQNTHHPKFGLSYIHFSNVDYKVKKSCSKRERFINILAEKTRKKVLYMVADNKPVLHSFIILFCISLSKYYSG